MADTATECLPAANLSDRPLECTDADIQQGSAHTQLEQKAVYQVTEVQQENSDTHVENAAADQDQKSNTVRLLEPTAPDDSDDIPEQCRDRPFVLSEDIIQGDNRTHSRKLAATNSEILDKMSMKIEFSVKTRSVYLSEEGNGEEDKEAKAADGDEHFDPVFEKIKESLGKMEGNRSRTASVSSGASDAENPFGKISEHYTNVPYGIQPVDTYEHGKNETDIMGVSYNGRMRQFIFLDSKGIVSWKRDRVDNRVTRSLMYPRYEYRLITYLVYARKHNCYFALAKDFSLKVLNRDFVETCSISADLTSVLFMLFNPLRDDLITGGVNGIQVYHFHQTTSSVITEVKPLANYQLTFRYSLPNVGGTWVKKVELDYNLEHLYCCSDTDLHVYNLEGKQLFQFHRAHSMSITGCRYSVAAKLLVTCSLDTEVKVWSMTGGLVHTFRGHSRPVTNLLIHPHNSTIIITCSLDGSVRMWSLDTMDEIYNLTVSTHGLLWMGLTDDNVLYISTARSLSMWNLNHFVHFWSLTRNQVTRLQLEGCSGKTQRVVAVGEDSSIRLFARSNQKNLSTVLPPPNVSPLQKILGVCYSREFNVIFVLINPTLIWVYTTRTDPACRIAVWNVRQIQIMSPKVEQSAQEKAKQMSSKPSPIHRATQNGVGNELPCNCQCVCILKSSAMLWTDEGCCCPVRHSYLLLGMEDGRVLFMDPVVKGQKYMEFKVSKDPVIGLHHDVDHQSLITVTSVKHLTLIQFWSLPDLELQHEVFCPPDLTGYARIGYSCMTGHESGFMLYHTLELATDPGFIKGRFMPELEDVIELNRHPEHMAPVITVDACISMKIFCSCSNDGAIKVWEENGALLTEIMLDDSLSALCFLNKSADLIIAYRKHIFFINHTKVCPHLKPLECEDLSFDKESYVYEDPAVAYEGFVEDPDPIDLENYLVPFEIEFSKDFLEGKVTLEPAKEVSEQPEEDDRLSFAPTEIYESRPSTPGSLSYVDLTLRSEVTKYDLMQQMKSTLEVLIEKQKRKAKRKTGVTSKDAPFLSPQDEEESQAPEGTEARRPPPFEFPCFDGSPGPTPTMTPSSSPEPVSEESEAEEETDTDDELRERLPPKKFPDMQLVAAGTQTKADKDVSDRDAPKDQPLPTPKRTRKAIADVEIDVTSLMKEKRSVMGTTGTSGLKKEADHSHVGGRSGGETVQREKPQRAPVKKKSVWQHKRAHPKEKRQPSPPRETVTSVSLQNDKEDDAVKQTPASDDTALHKDTDDTQNHETDNANEDVGSIKKKSTTERPLSSKSVESAKSMELPRADSVTETRILDTEAHSRQEAEASMSLSDSGAATTKDKTSAEKRDSQVVDGNVTATTKGTEAAGRDTAAVAKGDTGVNEGRPGTAASTSDARYVAGAQSPYPGSVGEDVHQARSQGSWVSSREGITQVPGPQEDGDLSSEDALIDATRAVSPSSSVFTYGFRAESPVKTDYTLKGDYRLPRLLNSQSSHTEVEDGDLPVLDSTLPPTGKELSRRDSTASIKPRSSIKLSKVRLRPRSAVSSRKNSSVSTLSKRPKSAACSFFRGQTSAYDYSKHQRLNSKDRTITSHLPSMIEPHPPTSQPTLAFAAPSAEPTWDSEALRNPTSPKVEIKFRPKSHHSSSLETPADSDIAREPLSELKVSQSLEITGEFANIPKASPPSVENDKESSSSPKVPPGSENAGNAVCKRSGLPPPVCPPGCVCRLPPSQRDISLRKKKKRISFQDDNIQGEGSGYSRQGSEMDFLPSVKDLVNYSHQPPSHIVPSTPTKLDRMWSHGSDSMFEEQDLDKGRNDFSSPRPPRSTPNLPQSPRLPSASTPRNTSSPGLFMDMAGRESAMSVTGLPGSFADGFSERGGASPDSAFPEAELAFLSQGEDKGDFFGGPLEDAYGGEDEDEHRAWSRIGLPDPTVMGGTRRPTTTSVVPSRHTLQLEGLIKRRPFTAAQTRFHTEELRSVFEAALERYKKNHGDVPGEGEKLYINRGINFEDKWQERALERHMLLRMQRLLRVCAAQQRRQALQQQRTKSAPLHAAGQQAPAGRLLRSSAGHASALSGRTFSPAPPATTPAASRPQSAVGGGQVPSLGQQQVMQREKRQQLLAQKEKQELGEEQPFRLRLREPAEKSPRTPREHRVKIDPWLMDPRNPSAVRPRSSKSIPSKCSRYVLLSRPRVVPEMPAPTALEEELLASRFPDQSIRIMHSARPSPPQTSYGVTYTPFSMYG